MHDSFKGQCTIFIIVGKKVIKIGIYCSSGVISPGKENQDHPNPLCLVFSSSFYHLVRRAGCVRITACEPPPPPARRNSCRTTIINR